MTEQSLENKLNYDGTPQNNEGHTKANEEIRLNIERGDIHPEIPEPGGTVLVLQVNARDDRRDPNSPEYGALVPNAAEQTVDQAKLFFDHIFEGLDPGETSNVALAVFASDAPLIMPGGFRSSHQRAYETAQKVIEGIEMSMTEHGVALNQLLNNSPETGGKPVPAPGLVDLKMWENPEFVDYLRKAWGEDFWKKYEGNWEEDMSLNQGVEVPPEVEWPAQIATRVRAALTDLTVDFAREYHEKHPNARLIIWVDAMYDNVAPWLKGYVYQANPAHLYTPIEKGGGLSIKISPDGQTATTKIGRQEYSVPSLLKQPKHAL